MPKRQHIDDILREWLFDPQSVSVRVRQGKNGRDVIQMRIDMGLLQMETTGRPDGERPGGLETYYDYLVGRAVHEGDDFVMTDEHCNETDREFVQFYHRRICWLALRKYRRAVADADHTLGLMDFCREHSPDEQWTMSHEQYRPFVLFHRTQAAALAELEESGEGGSPEAAIHEINRGLDELRDLFVQYEAEEHYDEDDLVQRLVRLREELRKEYKIGRTLHEQLADAVATEQYELAAKIRDELARREAGRH
jgi:hypothetical protein